MPATRTVLTSARTLTRRGVLVVTGTAAVVHIAGCTVDEVNGSNSTGGSGGTHQSGVAGAAGGAGGGNGATSFTAPRVDGGVAEAGVPPG